MANSSVSSIAMASKELDQIKAECEIFRQKRDIYKEECEKLSEMISQAKASKKCYQLKAEGTILALIRLAADKYMYHICIFDDSSKYILDAYLCEQADRREVHRWRTLHANYICQMLDNMPESINMHKNNLNIDDKLDEDWLVRTIGRAVLMKLTEAWDEEEDEDAD